MQMTPSERFRERMRVHREMREKIMELSVSELINELRQMKTGEAKIAFSRHSNGEKLRLKIIRSYERVLAKKTTDTPSGDCVPCSGGGDIDTKPKYPVLFYGERGDYMMSAEARNGHCAIAISRLPSGHFTADETHPSQHLPTQHFRNLTDALDYSAKRMQTIIGGYGDGI